MEIMLFSITDPIIESSSNIHFYPFNYSYPDLIRQMSQAGINLWNNNWSELYDFTPGASPNFKLIENSGQNYMPNYQDVEDDVMRAQSGIIDPDAIEIKFEAEQEENLIPVTSGNLKREYGVTVFVVFPSSYGQQVTQLFQIIRDSLIDWDRRWFRYTREFQLKPHEVEEIETVGKGGSLSFANAEPVIGWQICSTEDFQLPTKVQECISTIGITKYYLNSDKESVDSQANKFYKEYDKEDKGMKIN